MIINKEYIELQYFGSINLYSTLINKTKLFYLPNVPFKKAAHPNRQKLMGSNTSLLLTVPLAGGRDQKGKLKDIQISYSDAWQRVHWRGIECNYSKSPWFEEYAPTLQQLFQQKEKFLIDLNLKTMYWVFEKLKLKVDILADDEDGFHANEFLNASFQSQNSRVNYPVYTQVFSDKYGFVPNLGILDLLFCTGPLALEYVASVNHFNL